MSSKNSVDSFMVLRAASIAAVVFNRSYGWRNAWSLGLSGGMTFLLMMTGYNLARFGLKDASPANVRRALVLLARGLVVPSILTVLASAPFVGIDWRELLLISNWWPNVGNAPFPVEYTSMAWQMMLLFWLVSWLPIFRSFLAHPLLGSLILWAIGVMLRYEFPRPDLLHRLPWLYLWDFSLGLILYFALELE